MISVQRLYQDEVNVSPINSIVPRLKFESTAVQSSTVILSEKQADSQHAIQYFPKTLEQLYNSRVNPPPTCEYSVLKITVTLIHFYVVHHIIKHLSALPFFRFVDIAM
jgi:hypothetical protein